MNIFDDLNVGMHCEFGVSLEQMLDKNESKRKERKGKERKRKEKKNKGSVSEYALFACQVGDKGPRTEFLVGWRRPLSFPCHVCQQWKLSQCP